MSIKTPAAAEKADPTRMPIFAVIRSWRTGALCWRANDHEQPGWQTRRAI
jgi:hypothetical protein